MHEAKLGSELPGQTIVREIIDGEVNSRKRFDPHNPQATSIHGLFQELINHSGSPKRLYSHTDGASRRPVITELLRKMEHLYDQYGGFRVERGSEEILERGEDFFVYRDMFGIGVFINIPEVVLEDRKTQEETGWRRIFPKQSKGAKVKSQDLKNTLPQEGYYLHFSRLAGTSALNIEDEPREKAALITRYPFGKVSLGDKVCSGFEYDVALLRRDPVNPIELKILYSEPANA